MSWWTGNMNYVKRVFHNPCSTPNPTVLVETAFQALVPQLFAFNSLSCIDIVKNRAGISWKCGRMIKAAVKSGHTPQAWNRNQFLYKFLAPAERGLWYYFIAQQAQTFVADWMSLIYASQGCDLPINGHIEANIEEGIGGAGQVIGHSWPTRGAAGVFIGGDNIHVAPGVEADIMWHIQSKPAPWEHHATSMQTRLYRKRDGYTLAAGATNMQPDSPGSGTQNFGRATADPLRFVGEDWGIESVIGGGDTSYFAGELQITVRGKPVYPVPISCNLETRNKQVQAFLNWMNGTEHGPH